MAKCPKCENEISEPGKSLKNSCFHIEAYNCDKCGHCFKVTY